MPLQMISVVIPLRIVAVLMATAVIAVGKAEVYLHTMLVGAVVFPVCFLIGVQWGLNGLALAWPIAWLLNFSINLRRILQVLGLELRQVVLAVHVPLLAGIPMVGAIALTRNFSDALGDLHRLPLLVVVGGVTYAAMVFAVKPAIFQDSAT